MQAVLLVNLGTPSSTEVADVRSYLREFLMDERVIDYPTWARWLVVNIFVLPFRPKKTAAKYKTVWTEEGSPLMVYARNLQKLMQAQLDIPVEIAMRYGEPSIPSAVAKLRDAGLKDVLVIPLYPQYAMSTWETVAVAWQDAVQAGAPDLRYHLMPPCYDDPGYMEALLAVSKPVIESAKRPIDHLLISFHGVPERHIYKGDPSCAQCLKVPDCCHQYSPVQAICYRAQCVHTADHLAAGLGFSKERFSISFQSRFGPDKWLDPATDDTAKALAKKGVKHLAIAAPAFVADCLETLEELCEEVREEFLHAGGEEFTYIPCLNDNPVWADFLSRKVKAWQAKKV